MIRSVLPFAVLALLVALPAVAVAEPQKDVADAFIAAAQTLDHKAALDLLADDVSIEFPTGHGEGQPFVIGYLDGLFDAGRGLSLDSAATKGSTVRFQAHEERSLDSYAIEVEVKDHHVVKVTVNLEPPRSVAAS
jgi:hypothetical protein